MLTKPLQHMWWTAALKCRNSFDHSFLATAASSTSARGLIPPLTWCGDYLNKDPCAMGVSNE